MSKSVSNLKDSVSGMLQGLNLNNVRNLNTLLERTVRQLLIELDIPEAVARNNFVLYDGVTDYTAPVNMFEAGIVDIRPQGIHRTPNSVVQKQFGDQFDREKDWVTTGYKTTVEYNKGMGILRVASNAASPRIELDPMTATTGWVAAGSASGLVADQSIYWQAPASLKFTLTGASTGTLTKTISSTDLTDYLNVGVVFLAVYAADISNLTSITMNIGSSASNYYSVTASTGFVKAFASGEQQLISFDLSTATTTGTPVITKMNYLQFSFLTAGTINNFHMGDSFISLPAPQTLIYNTPSVFQPTGTTTINSSITDVTDTILLNDAAYAIYELKAAVNVAEQQGGTLSSGVVQVLDQKLNGVRGYRGILIQAGLIDLYRADNPSQELRMVGSYYEGIYG
jgi:hypothetical protein